MNTDLSEREYYVEAIVELISKIENINLLKYFYYFIRGKVKAEQ